MASIILPSRWTSQPQYQVEIDTSNPLCRGIIGAWAGNTRYDSSGRGQFLLGHVNYKPTEKGTGYAYPSTSSTVQPAYLADSANLDLPVSHTVFTLARVESTADQVLVAKRQNSLEYASWALDVGTLDSSTPSAGKLVYRVRTLNDGIALEAKTSGNVETGRVLAIAGWHDGSNVKLFVDGVESGSATGSGSAPFVGTSRVYIGGDNNAGFSEGRWFVTGAIPLVILFNRALSDGEIKALSANPWQIFRPQKRVLYFDVGAGGGITVAVNQSTETDTAQAINKVKLKAVGQATETDTVQAFTTSKLREVGQATETDTVQAFTTSKLREVGQVVETNTAQNITPSGPKLIAVGQASETDFAQAVAKAKALGILQPVETDSAHSITRVKARALGQVVDTSEAQPVTAVGGATPTLSPEDIASIAAAVWAHSTAVDAHAKLDAILARLQC